MSTSRSHSGMLNVGATPPAMTIPFGLACLYLLANSSDWGKAAAKFLTDVERGDPQQVMARATGNYKRGNERNVEASGDPFK